MHLEPFKFHRTLISKINSSTSSTLIERSNENDPINVSPFFHLVFYKYCCNGAFCPACPIKVTFKTLSTSAIVNESLNMDCVRYSSSMKINMMVQPGTYPIKITTTHNGDESGVEQEKLIGTFSVLRKSW